MKLRPLTIPSRSTKERQWGEEQAVVPSPTREMQAGQVPYTFAAKQHREVAPSAAELIFARYRAAPSTLEAEAPLHEDGR